LIKVIFINKPLLRLKIIMSVPDNKSEEKILLSENQDVFENITLSEINNINDDNEQKILENQNVFKDLIHTQDTPEDAEEYNEDADEYNEDADEYNEDAEDYNEDAEDYNEDDTSILTKDMLIELHQFVPLYEEIFSNEVAYALHQEDLTENSELYRIAETLLLKINKGYVLNLNNRDFIENIILLYQYGSGDIYPKLFEKLPEFLKIILTYHLEKEVSIHFWIHSLKSQLSIKDLMNVFNIPTSKNSDAIDIQQDRLALEPYCIVLDAALQEYHFETGEHNKSTIFTNFLNARLTYLELKQYKSPYVCHLEELLQAYPYTYRFLIEAAISVNYGNFLNGLVILQNMVFGGPSRRFIEKITHTLIQSKTYTIPSSDCYIPIPTSIPFPVMQPIQSIIFTPFSI
jgi:hypothetical protein